MNKLLIITVLLSGLSANTVSAENTAKDAVSLKAEVSAMKAKQENMNKDIATLKRKNAKAESRISSLESKNRSLKLQTDSLKDNYESILQQQKNDKSELKGNIGEANEKIQATENTVSSRTLWGACGIVALLIAIAATIFAFLKKFKSGTTSIDEIRNAQAALDAAQKKMQEETIQLDNKLIEVLSQHSLLPSGTTDSGEPDHSLTLKVADEIVKIETNLLRMDSSIRGYKQLSKGLQRIKDNFKANGYEIVDMLGKPYQEGMKAAATFETDETLEPGQKIITRIIKPQVNYNQKMIQAAQIVVSQPEE